MPRRWTRLATGLAVAAMVGALVLSAALAPGRQPAAFARERAARALMFEVPGEVLHLELRHTETWRPKGAAADPTSDERWSMWIDADRGRMREQMTRSSDGRMKELRVRTGDRRITLVRGEGEGTQRLWEEDVPTQPLSSALDDMVGYMRARIEDGSAKVIGTTTIDGDDYWIVRWVAEESDITLTVTLRKSDYRLATWAQDVRSGQAGTQEERVTLETLDHVGAESLPDDFFTFDAVRNAAEQRAPVETR